MKGMEIGARAARTDLLLLDVDGTMTDGRLYFFADRVGRAFDTQDGFGLRRLMSAGIRVALVTAADDDGDIARRARGLGIAAVHTGIGDKLAVVRQILADDSLPPERAAYMGDDLPDLPPMRHVGLAAAPKTAVAEILAVAHWTASRPAGSGAVRELCDLILASKAAAKK